MNKNIYNYFGKFFLKTLIIGGVVVLIVVIIGLNLINNNREKEIQTKQQLSIKQPSDYTRPLVIASFGNVFSISPVNAAGAQLEQVSGDTIKYVEAYQNTDVEQIKYPNKLKESLILKKPGHPEKFEYKIDMEKYDWEKDNRGNFIFYAKGKKGDELFKIFTIPAPYLIDADEARSSWSEVETSLSQEGVLTLKPSQDWLASHKYPIIMDPTVEINILNIYSHPQLGEEWIVEFTTQGQADLKIIPNDQATIDDDEFTGLYCGETKVEPQILAGDVIYYPNWQCESVARVVHYTLKAGKHTLRFEFGDEIAYAYNHPAAIAHDSSTSAGNNKTAQTASWSHTVAAGGVLFVTVQVRNSTDASRPVSSITYNNVALTKATSTQENAYDLGAEIWYITNPTTGSSQTILVTLTGATGNLWSAAATSLTGVDTSDPIGAARAASANSTSISATVTPDTANSWIMDSIYSKSNGTITPTRTQRSNQTVNSSGDWVGHSTTGPVSTATSMGWSWTPSGTNNAVICAVEIHAAVNSAPTIASVTDTPDPTNPGRSVSFITDWSDTDTGELTKIKVCKTNSLTAQNCDGGFWASSTAFAVTDPVTLVYDVVGGDAGQTRDYAVFICDDGSSCSAGTTGTFTVNMQNAVPNVRFR